MPKYINAEGRKIIASSKAYNIIFKEQGYKPFTDTVLVAKQKDEATSAESPNETMPVSAQTKESLDMMEYAEIKELAKNMDIPRYANTKKADLIELILEKQDGCENQE